MINFDLEFLRTISDKKERKELKRKLKEDHLRQLRILRRIQKAIFSAVFAVILIGGLYIIFALFIYSK